MAKISICLPTVYSKSRQIKILQELGDSLCKSYSFGFPRGYQYNDEPRERMYLTKIPSRITWLLVSPICSLFRLPKYYAYICRCRIFDWMVADKVAHDNSRLILTTTLLPKTIEACKKAGKYVIIEAGNSETVREYQRITSEYEIFGIKHKYIYGDRKFQMIHAEFVRNKVDKLICISKVSMNTYLDAGISKERIELIPLTGSPWEVVKTSEVESKPKAFITTGFHNFIKGTQRLLLAWRKAGITGIPLIIVGKLCEDMKEFIQRYGPFENVIYMGHLSVEQLKSLYGTYSACGVLLSLSEGAVRVTPEMMTYGFPMIVSPDATCDLVVDGVNGYVVNPLDEDAVVLKLRWFSDDWSRVETMKDVVQDTLCQRTMEDYAKDVAVFLISESHHV